MAVSFSVPSGATHPLLGSCSCRTQVGAAQGRGGHPQTRLPCRSPVERAAALRPLWSLAPRASCRGRWALPAPGAGSSPRGRVQSPGNLCSELSGLKPPGFEADRNREPNYRCKGSLSCLCRSPPSREEAPTPPGSASRPPAFAPLPVSCVPLPPLLHTELLDNWGLPGPPRPAALGSSAATPRGDPGYPWPQSQTRGSSLYMSLVIVQFQVFSVISTGFFLMCE